MGNIFNTDFVEFIEALNNCDVEYILVGGYSVVLHGYPRTTGDLDIWVNPTIENYKRLTLAYQEFGLPLHGMEIERFLDTKNFDVFSYGKPPVAIDIMTKCKDLDFLEAFKNTERRNVEGLSINLVHYNDLLKAKAYSGRAKDINNIENLKKN